MTEIADPAITTPIAISVRVIELLSQLLPGLA
jgi:hypothetical protein